MPPGCIFLIDKNAETAFFSVSISNEKLAIVEILKKTGQNVVQNNIFEFYVIKNNISKKTALFFRFWKNRPKISFFKICQKKMIYEKIV